MIRSTVGSGGHDHLVGLLDSPISVLGEGSRVSGTTLSGVFVLTACSFHPVRHLKY